MNANDKCTAVYPKERTQISPDWCCCPHELQHFVHLFMIGKTKMGCGACTVAQKQGGRKIRFFFGCNLTRPTQTTRSPVVTSNMTTIFPTPTNVPEHLADVRGCSHSSCARGSQTHIHIYGHTGVLPLNNHFFFFKNLDNRYPSSFVCVRLFLSKYKKYLEASDHICTHAQTLFGSFFFVYRIRTNSRYCNTYFTLSPT